MMAALRSLGICLLMLTRIPAQAQGFMGTPLAPSPGECSIAEVHSLSSGNRNDPGLVGLRCPRVKDSACTSAQIVQLTLGGASLQTVKERCAVRLSGSASGAGGFPAHAGGGVAPGAMAGLGGIPRVPPSSNAPPKGALAGRPAISGDQGAVKASAAPSPDHRPRYTEVKFFFATDRKEIQTRVPADRFSGERGENVQFGEGTVTIPVTHVVGQLETHALTALGFDNDPTRHVALQAANKLTEQQFFQRVRSRIGDASNADAFIFVHGYNVSFEDAARRTGQITHDLRFKGAPVLFSWPSRGTELAYTVDEQNIEWSETHIKVFLMQFIEQAQPKNVFLIAHSMGTRGLTRALIAAIRENPKIKERITEVILAAPDIDAAVFKRDIATALAASNRPVTLYASASDKALLASKKVHAYVRAGDAAAELTIVPGIETIDASNVDTSMLGHSYFASTRTILSDMYYLVEARQRAASRFGLVPLGSEERRYWSIAK